MKKFVFFVNGKQEAVFINPKRISMIKWKPSLDGDAQRVILKIGSKLEIDAVFPDRESASRFIASFDVVMPNIGSKEIDAHAENFFKASNKKEV